MKGLINIIVLIAIIVAIFFGYRSCQQGAGLTDAMKDAAQGVVDTAKDTAGAAADVATDAAGAAAGAAGGALKALGDFFSFKLPSGVSLKIPKFGIENKLIGFIKDGEISKDAWFNFDRINFASGSSNLSEESSEQIKNIAEILKAYPNIKLKVGGYTDNTGSVEVNMNISKARANAVKSAISALGVDAARMDAEGFGPAHPAASNDTPEGRAQNRRIALRVTEK